MLAFSHSLNSRISYAIGSPRLRGVLNSFGANTYNAFITHRSKTSKADDLVISFVPLVTFSEDSELQKFQKLYYQNGKNRFNPGDRGINYFSIDDIGYKKGQMIIGSLDDIEIKFGEPGIMARKGQTKKELLPFTKHIEGGTIGMLEVGRQVPFSIKMSNNSLAIAIEEMKKFPSFSENINRCSMHVLNKNKLPDKVSGSISHSLRYNIYNNLKNERFGNEITLPIYKADGENRSSSILMNFVGIDKEIENSDTHYHPGERVLYIFTEDSDSGVTINLCGINEIPDDRPDLRKSYNFPKNSIIVLKFPALAWHQFKGRFVCISNHPKEGENFIHAVKNNSLTDGYLTTATVFVEEKSKKHKDNDKPSSQLEEIRDSEKVKSDHRKKSH